jgi:tetratricopeptide (TPR) repeat protein
MAQGDLDAARVYWERGREQWAAAGDRNGVNAATHGLGDLALDAGDRELALAHYAEALDGAQNDPEIVANCLAGIAAALAGGERRDVSARLWATAQRLDAEHEGLIASPGRARYDRWVDDLPVADDELPVEQAIALALDH